MNWTEGLYKALFLLLVIALVARLIVGLLGPRLPSLLMLAGLVVIVTIIVRGPRTKK
jgi:hypothetical protein